MNKNCLTKQDYIEILRQICQKIDQNKQLLSELDSDIGDGDHGFSMATGFNSLNNSLDKFSSLDMGGLLKKSGFELIRIIGGAAGAVFGTLFVGQAGYYEKNLKGNEALTLTNIASMYSEALAQIKKRGNAQVGDKTMIDALEPAVKALMEGADKGMTIADAFNNAWEKAKQGAESTRELIGKKGRSKNLGERSRGFMDPGAMSTVLIFEVIADYFNKKLTKRSL